MLRICPRLLLASHSLIGLAISLTAADLASGENWPQWRGPESNGVASPGAYPVTFDAETGLAWKVVLPGVGASTPAVWGDRIFLTAGVQGADTVCAYDFTGAKLWQKSLGPERPARNRNASGSNPSPVTDGEHVVVYFKSGALACLDPSGEIKWQKNLQDLYGKDTLWWDLATSPVIVGDRAVVAVMHAGESFLVAFNLSDGAEAWKQPRQYQRPDESDQAYTTPQVAQIDGRPAIITFGADHLTAHEAETGKLLWDLDGFNPTDERMWRVIASPAISGGIAFIPYGRGEHLAAIRVDQPQPARLWERAERELGADVPTPVVDGDKAYLLTDEGNIQCLDLATGNELWSHELRRSRNNFFASPVLAGDHLYCVREDGVMFVVHVGAEPKLVATNAMGEKVIASPVPVRNGLLIRGEEHLFWIHGASSSPAAESAAP
ncbi:MAG TPA: PQQ-binding-like beta-propeller repeat protein [Lacipirellulaceae bacterium]|nr:PQQ-binding-like beta-propeller repeat protein [Lacipirellulaceae bacterium]